MTATANVDPLDYLQAMIAQGVTPQARRTQPPLATVASLPLAAPHTDLPTVATPGAWAVTVSQQSSGFYKVIAKQGSRVMTIYDLTYTDVETFNADARWSRPAPRLERLLGR